MDRDQQPTGSGTLRVTTPGELETGELSLMVTTGGPMRVHPLAPESELIIGRSDSADVTIDDPAISRHHAVIRREEGELVVCDNGSRNGTFVRSSRIEANTPVPLRLGEVVEIGCAILMVRRGQMRARPRRIWTHDYFEARLEEECARGARVQSAFAILRVNLPASIDEPVAESVLALVTRTVDVVGRYAPREYEMLLLESDADEAASAVERVTEELAERLHLPMTDVAVGVAHYPRDAITADALLAKACADVRGRQPLKPRPPAPAARGRHTVLIEKIAPSNLSVLILGETGVGKEVCARQIHELSQRSDKKMLALNCVSLSETLLESELFGYMRGAFTGATTNKPGLLETADQGTVFFDEIGELPLSTQVKLLRVLEERQVQRIGGLEPRAIDVRFIAATNRNLEVEVAAGRFRRDLYFRLNGFTLEIPPLRERVSELESLARTFVDDVDARNGKPPGRPIVPDAMKMLCAYSWPGNIRELRNIMERAVVLCGAGPIEVAHLPAEKMRATIMPTAEELSRTQRRRPAPEPPSTDSSADESHETWAPDEAPTPVAGVTSDAANRVRSLGEELRQLERARIIAALEAAAGNQTRAAEMLGIRRGKLLARLDTYGIPRPRKGAPVRSGD